MITVTVRCRSERMRKMKQMKKVVFLTQKELAEKARKRREYVPPRPVFRTAEWYARTAMLMCQDGNGRLCRECPLGMNTDESGKLIPCALFQLMYPAEAVKRVEMWWIENRDRFPEYVRKDDR